MSYRARTWRSIDRRKGVYRKKSRPIFMKALEKHIAPLYEIISMTYDINNVTVPELDNEAITDAYKALYMSAALDFAKFDRRQAKSMAGVGILKDEDEIMADIMIGEIMDYLATDVGSTIVAIGDTSKELLRKLLKDLVPEIIEQGYGAGAAQTMLRDQINSKWHKMRYFRTERIVRTETNRACNFGSIKGVKSTGIPYNKQWLASFVQRQSHMQADGQEVDINDHFDVGGESLDFPGDPMGSAGNTINCGCSITYAVKK